MGDGMAVINQRWDTGMAGVIGGPLSGAIMKMADGVYGWAGWQWMFLLEGVPSVILGVAVILLLKDRIADAQWLTDDEKALLVEAYEAVKAKQADVKDL